MRTFTPLTVSIILCSLIHPCQSSFIQAFVSYFKEDASLREFNDDVPEMIREAIMTGEIKNYLNQESINHFFSQRGQRKLQETDSTIELRACDEEIYTFTSAEVKSIMKDYLAMAVGTEGIAFQRAIESWIERRWKYGLAAYKICASCADFRDAYGGTGEGLNAFDEYCGEGIYAADDTHSGLLYIPVGDDGESIDLTSKLAIWNRWVEFQATECPSEQFNAGTDWGSNFEEFDRWGYTPTGFLTAPLGVVSLLPDYVGFCESYLIDGAPANKKAYQTGIIPLVLKARDVFLDEKTDGKTRLTNEVVSSGFSEGGMTALVVGWALESLGFDVTTQAGGSAIDHKSVDGLFNYYAEVMSNGLASRFRSILAGWAATYSSVNPNLPNTDVGQDFLSEESRDEVLAWFRGNEDNLGEYEIADTIDELYGDDFSRMFNPDIHEMIMSARATQGVTNTCELAIEGKTDLFCEAIQSNDITKELAETNNPTDLCWTTGDELFLFKSNVPPFWKRLMNPKLKAVLIPSVLLDPGDSGVTLNHQTAGGYCLVLNALQFHRRNF